MATSKRTLENLPVLRPGERSCDLCVRQNMAGGDNSCPIKELRPRYEKLRAHDCASFREMSVRQAQSRVGQYRPPITQDGLF